LGDLERQLHAQIADVVAGGCSQNGRGLVLAEAGQRDPLNPSTRRRSASTSVIG
jgi:hypothetical protein